MKATIKNQEEQSPQLEDTMSNHHAVFDEYEDLIEEEDKPCGSEIFKSDEEIVSNRDINRGM